MLVSVWEEARDEKVFKDTALKIQRYKNSKIQRYSTKNDLKVHLLSIFDLLIVLHYMYR